MFLRRSTLSISLFVALLSVPAYAAPESSVAYLNDAKVTGINQLQGGNFLFAVEVGSSQVEFFCDGGSGSPGLLARTCAIIEPGDVADFIVTDDPNVPTELRLIGTLILDSLSLALSPATPTPDLWVDIELTGCFPAFGLETIAEIDIISTATDHSLLVESSVVFDGQAVQAQSVVLNPLSSIRLFVSGPVGSGCDYAAINAVTVL